MFGTIFYVSLLLINAMAVLNEERFLARIGWLSSSTQQPRETFQQSYDQNSYGVAQGDVGVKARMVDLISAVRTLMRIPLIALNMFVIFYELALG